MSIDFVAIDFETANEHRASICAAALIAFEDGRIVQEHEWIVQPPEHLNYFNPINIQIHGITPEAIVSAPRFSAIWPEMREMMNHRVVVAHNAGFDVSVLMQLIDHYGLEYPEVRIVCTCIVARKTWEKQYNYRLKTLANGLGYIFDHHDAHDDARTCGKILVDACKHHNCSSLTELARAIDMIPGSIDGDEYYACWAPDMYRKVQRQQYGEKICMVDLNSVSPMSQTLLGRNVVFTGALISMTRQTAAQMVVERGGAVSNTLNLTSNLLVMGVQDYSRFVDHEHSSKTKRALMMIEQGRRMEIIDETDFLGLVLKGE